jgi:hypothetical protein
MAADFFACIKSVMDRLGAKPLVMQLPIGAEHSFNKPRFVVCRRQVAEEFLRRGLPEAMRAAPRLKRKAIQLS